MALEARADPKEMPDNEGVSASHQLALTSFAGSERIVPRDVDDDGWRAVLCELLNLRKPKDTRRGSIHRRSV